MTSKWKKYSFILGMILAIIIGTTLIVSTFVTTLISEQAKKDKTSAYSLSFGDVESLGLIYGDTRKVIEFSGEDITEIEVHNYKIVDGQTVPGSPDQLYCKDYGTEFWTMENLKYSVSAFEGEYGSIYHYGSGNSHTSYDHTKTFSTKTHVPKLHNGDITYPWLVKQGDIDLLTKEHIQKAYVLTSPDIGRWNVNKQRALWAVQGQIGATTLSKEAEQYEKYYDATQVQHGSVERPDLNIKGSVDDIKVVAHFDENSNESTITIGPIDLTYINKNNGNVAFGGISSMYFRGYNLQGEKIKNNIKIEKYIDKTGTYNLSSDTYFTPEDDSFVDHGKQVYPQGKDEFYVVIKNPNVGKTSADDDFISELDLCIGFQWMTINEALASDMNTYQYTVNWYNHSDSDYYRTCKHKHYSHKVFVRRTCYNWTKLIENQLQSVLNYYGGIRELFGTTVVIEGFDITMDLGGTVWEDGVSTKESIADGVNNSPEQEGKKVDKPIEGIKVNLWAVESKSAGKTGKFVTYTYTNENGNYMFEHLNSLLKYYVTFEYNGQQYLPTEYLKGQYSSVQDMVKAGQYNGSQDWHITSKGIENANDRNAYDQKFAEIGSAPANYASSDSLKSGYLANGYNVAFSQYALMGFKMTENGDYVEENRLIDSFYKIEGGNIVETDEQQIGLITKKIQEYIEAYSKAEKVKMNQELDREFSQKIADWNNKVNTGMSTHPDMPNPEGQRASGLRKLQKQKEERQKYIEKLVIMPDYDTMIKEVYADIAGSDKELWQKLQFTEDSKITSYTQNLSEEVDLYPVYDDIYINRNMEPSSDGKGQENTPKEYDTIEDKINDTYNQEEPTIGGRTYKPIYEGQFFVNLGLWRRQEVDLALRKDILYAATRINGKTEVYEYNKRNELTTEQKAELRRLRQVYEQNGRQPSDYQAYLAAKAQFEQANRPNDGKEDYWQIQLRMRDYNNYYSGNYTKELYTADYNYRSASTNKAGEDKELQLYVTYKITVRNVSESILGEITEIVDYYDKDYTYRDDLSWVMYKRNSNSNDLEEINFTESDYYDTIDQLKLNDKISSNNKGTQSSTSGQYEARSSECRSDMTSDYNDIYIKGLAGKKLASGEEAFIYLTFEVNKQNGKIITDEDNTLKQNYVEINGYKTYYKDGTQLPNGVTKGSNDPAGLIDINSTPGNLCKKDLEGNKYEKNFENDTDRAKSIKVIVQEEFIRSINGNVWEDQRTQTVSQAIIGDGMRQGSEIGVTGATVELVERLADGSEYVWQTTKTQNGKYEFKTDKDNKIYIIPGNYFIRFHYGDTTATANTTANGGSNTTSYNGQDFKSTVYQKDMKNGKELDEYKDTKIEGYDGKYQGTEVGYYDIKQLDTLRGSGNNFSDAKDIWREREKVINYSNNQVTNGKAEILASPYTTGNTAELINNTKMTAVTGLIVLEGEYNRTGTDGDAGTSNGENDYKYGNDYNGKYTLNDVDLGITERPKAALELGKKITNVQIKLANGNILFDANKGMTDLQWRSGSAYKLNEGIKNHKYPEYYGASQDRYAYRTSVKALVDGKYDSQGNNGLIVATMDEELMQGANIKISYLLTVTNVGETDYEGQDFYYKGTGAGTVVTTKADIVADYVANNLNFKTDNNNGTGWQITDSNALELSNDAKAGATKYNNIIRTSNLNKALTPGDNTTVGLVLTQLINPENSTDDKTYDNIAEITTISNTVGRRMAYSIQGNQDPTKTPAEVDSVKSERVTILPPFGSGNIIVYIAITAGVLAILTVGIIFIKKKVLNK